jgi:molybdate transport system substrate-binding protein
MNPLSIANNKLELIPMCSRYLVITALLLMLPLAGQAGEVSVAVASNFTAPAKIIAALFEEKTGHNARLSFGSSGKLYAQIGNDAPYEVFLSADQETPAALIRSGQGISGSQFTYAEGSLALWTANTRIEGQLRNVLESGAFHTLAIANPDLAPYGAAAIQVMENMGIDIASIPRIVKGDNVAQTYLFVSTGNADLGFIALSQIMTANAVIQGSSWIVPHDLHDPVRQDAVLLAKGLANPAAKAFLAFLKGAETQAVIVSYGYRLDTGP